MHCRQSIIGRPLRRDLPCRALAHFAIFRRHLGERLRGAHRVGLHLLGQHAAHQTRPRLRIRHLHRPRAGRFRRGRRPTRNETGKKTRLLPIRQPIAHRQSGGRISCSQLLRRPGQHTHPLIAGKKFIRHARRLLRGDLPAVHQLQSECARHTETTDIAALRQFRHRQSRPLAEQGQHGHIPRLCIRQFSHPRHGCLHPLGCDRAKHGIEVVLARPPVLDFRLCRRRGCFRSRGPVLFH